MRRPGGFVRASRPCAPPPPPLSATDKCVQRPNDRDDGRVAAPEGGDRCETIGRIVGRAGFEAGEDGVDRRER